MYSLEAVHSSGGWKSESKVSAGFIPSECCEKESFLENILFYLLGCIRSYLWHTGSLLQLMDSLAVALGFGCPIAYGILGLPW